MTFHATLLTLFPDMFPGPLGHGLIGQALSSNIWSLDAVDIRSFATDVHKTVDDRPYGGGAGMVLKPDIIGRALQSVDFSGRQGFVLSPCGKPVNQTFVRDLSKKPGAVMLCGRYEAIDQRVIEAWDLIEISLGDFVLCGGEVAALAVLEATIRLLPGVLGNSDTVEEESFSNGLIEYPHYTRPPIWEGRSVPEVLLSGDHAAIKAWRHQQSEQRTKLKRPDLWDKYQS